MVSLAKRGLVANFYGTLCISLSQYSAVFRRYPRAPFLLSSFVDLSSSLANQCVLHRSHSWVVFEILDRHKGKVIWRQDRHQWRATPNNYVGHVSSLSSWFLSNDAKRRTSGDLPRYSSSRADKRAIGKPSLCGVNWTGKKGV